MLAWALKAAENRGRDAAEVIASASRACDPARGLPALVRVITTHQQAPSLPPWISAPAASSLNCSSADRQIGDYLDAAADEIGKRVKALIADATQTRAAWVNALGVMPSDHARQKEWLHHVGVIAAYRDQCRISSDHPRQVLGPCAEPGHADHSAYWHAAEAVLTARTIAGPEYRASKRNEVGARMTADLYLGLPDDERAAISAAMAERLGVLWFGARCDTDDHAATRPVYASQLAAAFTERGHLTHEIAAHVSLASASATTIADQDEPVEAAFARRHAARRSTQITRGACRRGIAIGLQVRRGRCG